MGQKWEFGPEIKVLKYQFFTITKSAFVIYSQFPLRNGLKLRFVFFKIWESYNAAGMSSPSQGMTFSDFEKDKPQFKAISKWKLAIGHKSTFSQCKKLIFKIFLFDQILTFDPWPRGWPQSTNFSRFFWNYLNIVFNLRSLNDTWFRILEIGYFS